MFDFYGEIARLLEKYPDPRKKAEGLLEFEIKDYYHIRRPNPSYPTGLPAMRFCPLYSYHPS
jgi:hypothetical protein